MPLYLLCRYGLSFGIMDVEDAAKGAELRIALQRETRVCYPIGAVAGAFAAVAAYVENKAPFAGQRSPSGLLAEARASVRHDLPAAESSLLRLAGRVCAVFHTGGGACRGAAGRSRR